MSRDLDEEDDSDEFGGIADDDLILAAELCRPSGVAASSSSHPSPLRPPKRRRLDDDNDDEDEDEGTAATTPGARSLSWAKSHRDGLADGSSISRQSGHFQQRSSVQSERKFRPDTGAHGIPAPASCPPKATRASGPGQASRLQAVENTSWHENAFDTPHRLANDDIPGHSGGSMSKGPSNSRPDKRKEQLRPGGDHVQLSSPAPGSARSNYRAVSVASQARLAERSGGPRGQSGRVGNATATPATSTPATSFSSPATNEGDTGTPRAAPRPAAPSVGQRSVNTAGSLRQTTLFGAPVQNPSGAPSQTIPDEPRTHHALNQDALGAWVYPMNLGAVRDYQYNIVQKGLFHNLLVALPTGLGKTFIAATIMLNWFRWTTKSQIVFVAPTKPLVAQQIDACFKIVGIPRSQTTLLTGATPPGLRAEEWSTKRVFFMTPQTMINDLRTGVCDPKRIVCLVVDEAHRATGNYAYVEVVKFIRRFNSSFRVLALTATPGSTVEAVQAVIDGLDISRVEIRTEESIDIRRFVQRRNVETEVFEPSEEIDSMKELFSKTLQPILDELNRANAYWVKDPMSLTAYGLTQARAQWMNSDVGRRANQGLKGKLLSIFALLASLAHAITLLHFHGVGPFYHYLAGFRSESGNGEKVAKWRKQVLDSPDFHTLMNQARGWVDQPDFIGHPKLAYLRQAVLNHFLDADTASRTSTDARQEQPTRIMVFVQYRDSAEEIVRVLQESRPMVRPHVFVGQAAAKSSAGMTQKAQLEVIEQFKKGTYNTLVATCVGEEGLDIGEVDLIICYDSSASPIRMLQRMGRTGRKRAGNIYLLLMRGKEEDSFTKAKDAYEKMQQMIAAGTRFSFHDDLSPRILSREMQPVVEKRNVEIPIENSQGDLPEPRRRGKAPKRPPKKFHMPDGVQTGFVTASKLGHGRRRAKANDTEESQEDEENEELVLADVPALEEVVLTSAAESELRHRYQYVHDDEGNQVIAMPSLDAHPRLQASLRPTKAIPHSSLSSRTVKMLGRIRDIDEDRLSKLEDHLHPGDRERISRGRRLFSSATAAHSSVRKLGAKSRGRPVQSTSPEHGESSGSSPAGEALRGTVEEDDGMEDFVVEDDVEELASSPAASLLPSSLPSSQPGARPFYQSPKRRSSSHEDVDGDGDLPDLTTLVHSKSGPPAVRNADTRNLAASKTVDQRRKRPTVVLDSDDDDL
ncbi:MAG: 3'-5' DNA helicase [Lichina confinis]|nr:MAG: 3'-5' DNA helicase [Lichina confinis]